MSRRSLTWNVKEETLYGFTAIGEVDIGGREIVFARRRSLLPIMVSIFEVSLRSNGYPNCFQVSTFMDNIGLTRDAIQGPLRPLDVRNPIAVLLRIGDRPSAREALLLHGLCLVEEPLEL